MYDDVVCFRLIKFMETILVFVYIPYLIQAVRLMFLMDFHRENDDLTSASLFSSHQKLKIEMISLICHSKAQCDIERKNL